MKYEIIDVEDKADNYDLVGPGVNSFPFLAPVGLVRTFRNKMLDFTRL